MDIAFLEYLSMMVGTPRPVFHLCVIAKTTLIIYHLQVQNNLRKKPLKV